MENFRIRWWILGSGLMVLAHAVISFTVPESTGLKAFGNLLQSALLLAAVVVMGGNARVARGNARVFWLLIAAGCVLWLGGQLWWSYYEVVLRQEVPDQYLGDMVFFLHVVPMMAALGLQPHAPREYRSLRMGYLEFLLLMLWWIYLYLFAVTPWQYVSVNSELYSYSYNSLDMVEKLVFVVGAGVLWIRTWGPWKKIYAHLFGAAFLYLLGSQMINRAIDVEDLHYHTGSVYDIPLVASMAWFVGLGLMARKVSAASEPVAKGPRRQGIWPAWPCLPSSPSPRWRCGRCS